MAIFLVQVCIPNQATSVERPDSAFGQLDNDLMKRGFALEYGHLEADRVDLPQGCYIYPGDLNDSVESVNDVVASVVMASRPAYSFNLETEAFTTADELYERCRELAV